MHTFNVRHDVYACLKITVWHFIASDNVWIIIICIILIRNSSPGAGFVDPAYDVVAVKSLKRRKVTLVAFHESAP